MKRKAQFYRKKRWVWGGGFVIKKLRSSLELEVRYRDEWGAKLKKEGDLARGT